MNSRGGIGLRARELFAWQRANVVGYDHVIDSAPSIESVYARTRTHRKLLPVRALNKKAERITLGHSALTRVASEFDAIWRGVPRGTLLRTRGFLRASERGEKSAVFPADCPDS